MKDILRAWARGRSKFELALEIVLGLWMLLGLFAIMVLGWPGYP